MKLSFIDTETTGTNPFSNGLIQLSGIIEIDNEIVNEFDFNIKPFESDIILDSALEVNGLSRETLNTFPESNIVFPQFTSIISKYVDKYNRNDKFHFIGFNARLDDDFLRSWFKKCGDNYYGSFFFWPAIDVANIAAKELMAECSKLENFKLATVAKYVGIEVDDTKLHDSMYDVRLTRELFYHFDRKYRGK